jgi:hypothetical protein
MSTKNISKVKLQISNSSDTQSGVSYYNVYRKKFDNDIILIGSISTKQQDLIFYDSDVEGGATYTYYVTSIDRAGNESDFSDGITYQIDQFNPPLVVSGFTAKANNKDYIYLKWDETNAIEDDQTVEEYILQISRDNGINWNDINSTNTNFTYYYYDRTIDNYPEKSDLLNYRFRIKAVSIRGLTSVDYAITNVNSDGYLTWVPPTPTIELKANSRNISLGWSDVSKSIYGQIEYHLQITKKYLINNDDTITDLNNNNNWFCPTDDTSLVYVDGPDLLSILYGNDPENVGWQWHHADLPASWHTTSEYKIINGSVFFMNLPLDKQVINIIREDENHLTTTINDTDYYFRIRSHNIESDSVSNYSGNNQNGILVIASGTTAQDIIQNAINTAHIVDGSITAEKILVKELSAITANLGLITDGALQGNSFNYWALSDIVDEQGQIKYKQGSMRVGGLNQYFEVVPIIENGVVIDYSVQFKVGLFTITSDFSQLNGELTVVKDGNSLERTRINPNGIYQEYRESPYSDWRIINHLEVSGLLTRNIWSPDNLSIANGDITLLRQLGHDVGIPYLSSLSEVYHFDVDLKNQKGENNLILSYSTPPILVDSSNNEETITITDDDEVDGGYAYDEFDDNDYGGGGASFHEDNESPIDFTPAIVARSPYSSIGKALYGQCSLKRQLTAINITVDFWFQYVWSENQVLFRIGNDLEEIFLSIVDSEVYYNDYELNKDPFPYDNSVLDPEAPLVYNQVKTGGISITHTWQGGNKEIDYLENHNKHLQERRWYHFAIVFNSNNVSLFVDDIEIDFNRYQTSQQLMTIFINENENSLIFDELMIDPNVAIPFNDFVNNTNNKIPWAALNSNNNYFILDAKDPQYFKTNIFNSDDFRNAVLSVVNDM